MPGHELHCGQLVKSSAGVRQNSVHIPAPYLVFCDFTAYVSVTSQFLPGRSRTLIIVLILVGKLSVLFIKVRANLREVTVNSGKGSGARHS